MGRVSIVKIKFLLDAFFAWVETLQVSGKNKLVDAVRYTLNEKKYLYTFLEDGNVPIDNNRAENAIRPFTVGRKKWLNFLLTKAIGLIIYSFMHYFTFTQNSGLTRLGEGH